MQYMDNLKPESVTSVQHVFGSDIYKRVDQLKQLPLGNFFPIFFVNLILTSPFFFSVASGKRGSP